jgi:hypothetical protein
VPGRSVPRASAFFKCIKMRPRGIGFAAQSLLNVFAGLRIALRIDAKNKPGFGFVR